jgi:hypothetical protein
MLLFSKFFSHHHLPIARGIKGHWKDSTHVYPDDSVKYTAIKKAILASCDTTEVCHMFTDILKQCAAATFLNIEAACFFDILVPTLQTTWCHNPEYHNINLHWH